MENLKRAKVHRLPTEDASRIMMFGGTDLIYSSVNKKGNNRFHLYITTDEEIKEGDWYYDRGYKQVIQYGVQEGVITKECRKIIATTDPKLVYSLTCEHSYISGGKGMCNTMKCCGDFMKKKIAQPSQAFIEAYCKAGGIDEVLVEVERMSNKGEWKDVLLPSEWGDHNPTRPKLNPDNTIIIHPVEEKMYSRDKVIELMKKAIKQGDDWRCELDRIAVGFSKENPDVISEQLLNPIKWIEENL